MKTTQPARPEPLDVKIEFSQSTGLIRVVDSRIIRADRRSWCCAVAQAAACRQGVQSVRLNLETATCEIQFTPGPSASTMADVFAASMNQASAAGTSLQPARRSWFKRSSPRPESWSVLAAFAAESQPSIWKARLKETGLIEIDHESFSGSRRVRSRLLAGLQAFAAVPGSCRIDRRSRKLELRFEPDRFDLAQILDTAEHVRAGKPNVLAVLQPEVLPALSPAPSILVSGRKRVLYLALGGGSFALIFAGITVPGIPTVTFAVLSGYYLARSSIRLHDHLVRSGFFGPIIHEWSKLHGLSKRSKLKLIGLIAAAVAVSFSIVTITPMVLGVTFVLSTGGVYTLLHLPGIEGDVQTWPPSWAAGLLPAPAPSTAIEPA